MKKTALILCLSAPLLFISSTLHSQESSPVPKQSQIYANEEGIAIAGYDAVSFFDGNAAVVGQAEHSCSYLGKTWHFSSKENRDRFLASPEKFTPEYGGYCAHSIGKGDLVKANPEAFLIRDEKLYFYANQSFRNKEAKRGTVDLGDLIKKRKANWSKYEASF